MVGGVILGSMECWLENTGNVQWDVANECAAGIYAGLRRFISVWRSMIYN